MENRIIYIKGTTHSPNLIEGYTSTESRLIAGKGKSLTNGIIICPAIDIPNEDVSLWWEVDYVEPELEEPGEPTSTTLETIIKQLEDLL